LRAVFFCAAICVSAFVLALQYAPSEAQVSADVLEEARATVEGAAIDGAEIDGAEIDGAAIDGAEIAATETAPVADPIAAEIAAAAAAENAPPPVAPRLARAAPDLADRLRPLAVDDRRWGRTGTRQSADDEDIRRKLTEAGRRLKALMDDDGSGSDVAEADESPQLAYAAPDEPEEPARAAADEADFGNIALTSARTRSAVNFRRAARKGAPVIEVIPGGAEIEVAAGDCPAWCPTVYNGRKGYIFRDYIQRASAAPARKPKAAAAPAREAEEEKPSVAPVPMVPRQGGR